MKSFPTRFLLPLVLGSLLTGCGGPDPKEEATETLSIVFNAFKRSDLEGALMLYSPTFFKSTSRQDWLGQLQQIHNSLGPVVSYEILDASSEKKEDPAPGTYVGFACRVNYQRGALTENIVLVRPEGFQAFTISGHQITDSDGVFARIRQQIQQQLQQQQLQQQQQQGGQAAPPAGATPAAPPAGAAPATPPAGATPATPPAGAAPAPPAGAAPAAPAGTPPTPSAPATPPTPTPAAPAAPPAGQ